MCQSPDRDSQTQPTELDDRLLYRRAESYPVRVVAQAGDRYVVTLDGSADERAPAVVYYAGRVSHVAMLASHLKMFNAYVDPFTGSEQEGEGVEARVRELLDGGGSGL